jgi:hypothetical protein
MACVIINDFVSDRRTEITFNHPQDFQRVDAMWEDEDQLLRELQTTEAFKGKTRWCDLTPMNYRFLLMNVLNKVSALSDEEQSDPGHEAMSSLTFCLSALLKCLEDRSQSTVELLRVNRLGEQEMLYDFTASVNMQLERKPTKGFRVVVDNT